jgi:bifunctional non-homologous end joining protein LigD
MSLKKYNSKRTFTKTPEPTGKKLSNKGPLTFVVQKHEASRLHYDFRLELDGVLKSWAVPKGPSMSSDDKHLAVLVEDHPLDYASFEGTIPKGNYGAGTVMVWDRGVYMPYGAVERDDAEKILREEFKKGHLTFILLGEKLKGEFALIKSPHMSEDAWLLVKKGDEYQSRKDILKEDKSVISGRSMDEISTDKKGNIWISRPDSIKRHAGLDRANLEEASTRSGISAFVPVPTLEADPGSEFGMTLLNNVPKSKFPHHIKPMLAHSVDTSFDRKKWIFELKWDGYRAIAEIEKGQVNLHSRNQLSFNERFNPIVQSLKQFDKDIVLDGELVVVDKTGRPSFGLIQDYPEGHGTLIYYVFDILYYDGHSLIHLPLIKRKEILKAVVPKLPNVRLSDYIFDEGKSFFSIAQKLKLEGIMAKDGESEYAIGERSQNWLKIRTHKREEAVICGFTNPKGRRSHFGALILGVYLRGKLHYIGHAGGGFNEQALDTVFKKLTKITQYKCPFEEVPMTNGEVTWVKPNLLCEVEFKEWTKGHIMRHPVFMGLREDKSPKEVVEEKVFSKNPPSNGSTKVVTIGKLKLELANLDKIFWPKEKYTKADLLKYYTEISDIILPHLKDRPQSMLRWPNGITGDSFFQKDTKSLNARLSRISIESESRGESIEYFLCQDKASLLYMVNLGCIDFNPWSSIVGHLDYPDYLIIDLDPEKTNFKNVVTVALEFRKLFEKLEVESFPKTSGKRGMHIYISMGRKYTYEQVRQFAQLLCIQVHQKLPKITSLVHNPKERQGKVYLDYLRNAKGQTAASVYSVRAYKGATVSTPLKWEEVNLRLDPGDFTMKSMVKRVGVVGDLFVGTLRKSVNIEDMLNKLDV